MSGSIRCTDLEYSPSLEQPNSIQYKTLATDVETQVRCVRVCETGMRVEWKTSRVLVSHVVPWGGLTPWGYHHFGTKTDQPLCERFCACCHNFSRIVVKGEQLFPDIADYFVVPEPFLT